MGNLLMSLEEISVVKEQDYFLREDKIREVDGLEQEDQDNQHLLHRLSKEV